MPPHFERKSPDCDNCVYPEQITSVQTHLRDQDKKLDRIIRFLEGDDLDETKPGIKVRLDRVERFIAGVKWTFITAAGVAITAFTTWVLGMWKASK